jgi:transcriptional regulator with XRE-family HTH domain
MQEGWGEGRAGDGSLKPTFCSELTAWCRARHSRQRELAALLGVSEQLVSNWLARRKTPTLQHGLQIQEILKKQRKSRNTDG